VIVDDEVAVLPRDGSSGAMLVHGPDLVGPVAALFDELWHDAVPVTPASDGSREPPVTEARIRQVVSLLAQGHKDETIARRLGVSVRTVRRFVSAAVSTLHAESRFQAGVLAAKRGWAD
jgi:DNA-binding NarL/FixJ family response regulator